jgi:hypothetical protein
MPPCIYCQQTKQQHVVGVLLPNHQKTKQQRVVALYTLAERSEITQRQHTANSATDV